MAKSSAERDLARALLQLAREKAEYIDKEIKPNAPAVIAFGHMEPQDNPHPKYGLNVHPLVCGRCKRDAGIPVPMGKFSVQWSCNNCHATTYNEDLKSLKCPGCGKPMEQKNSLDPGEPVSFDYRCKICRESFDRHMKAAENGGVIVKCFRCHTVSVLPKDHHSAKALRKSRGVKPEDSVELHLDTTQCPRCADHEEMREFTPDETARVLITDEDMVHAHVWSHKKLLKDSKEARKKSKQMAKAVAQDDDVSPDGITVEDLERPGDAVKPDFEEQLGKGIPTIQRSKHYN